MFGFFKFQSSEVNWTEEPGDLNVKEISVVKDI